MDYYPGLENSPSRFRYIIQWCLSDVVKFAATKDVCMHTHLNKVRDKFKEKDIDFLLHSKRMSIFVFNCIFVNVLHFNYP